MWIQATKAEPTAKNTFCKGLVGMWPGYNLLVADDTFRFNNIVFVAIGM